MRSANHLLAPDAQALHPEREWLAHTPGPSCNSLDLCRNQALSAVAEAAEAVQRVRGSLIALGLSANLVGIRDTVRQVSYIEVILPVEKVPRFSPPQATQSRPRIPLLGGEQNIAIFTDPAQYSSLVSQFLPLQIDSFDHPDRQNLFFNYAAAVCFGGLTVLSTWGSAIVGDIVQECGVKLVIPFGKYLHDYQLGRKLFSFSDSCLFIPEHIGSVRLRSSVCAAVVISLSPASLLLSAMAMAGGHVDEQGIRSIVERPAILDRHTDSRRDQLHHQLIAALNFIDRTIEISGSINEMLRIDDLIKRLIVMLLIPDLFNSLDSAADDTKVFVHADLVEWMLANLDQPISLTELELRSNFSRRSLQYAFKQRFGCGPMQWLRKQRLAKAHAMLELHQGSSIIAVAQACGYISQASFSRDYRLRFGRSPRQTWLRKGDGVD